jgi:hypothetical protein
LIGSRASGARQDETENPHGDEMVQVIRHLNLFMTGIAAAIFSGWLMLA